jgi:hypothetical protein
VTLTEICLAAVLVVVFTYSAVQVIRILARYED